MSYFVTITSHSLEGEVSSKVREVLLDLILPKLITRTVLNRYLQRAMRNGSWKTLDREERSLLYVAAKTVNRVKSPTLKSVLGNIVLKIEMATTWGKALYYGVLVAMMRRLDVLIKNVKSEIRHVLYLGISYLNTPLTYRIYG